jgi:hypothetical protein
MKIDPLPLQMEAWLSGTKTFLDAISRASSEPQVSEAAGELKRRAESEGWPAEDYFTELYYLEQEFEQWLPKLSAYSAIILLHSFVETHLRAYAKRLERDRASKLAVGDVTGKGITQARAYIVKVAEVPIGNDLAWHELFNLQDIRNIIVHRRGRVGESQQHVDTVERLLKEYPEDLSVAPSTFGGVTNLVDQDQELVPTFRLCFHFLTEVEAFFRRLCKTAGFQERFLE